MPEPSVDNLKDASPKKIRDLKVEIITAIAQVDVTSLVIELSLYEDIYDPFVKGDLTIADNSGIISGLPVLGQELVKIKFSRSGHEIEKTFACTRVRGIKKVVGETAGAVLSLTSQKHLTNAVSMFSKSYKGLSSDIIQKIHSDAFGEDIDIVSESGSAHSIVFPYIKPYAAINAILRKTTAADGTPYFLYENLFGEKPILKSLQAMCEEESDTVLKKNINSNADTDMGFGQRDNPSTIGQLYEFEVLKNADTLKLLSSGALVGTTARINLANNEYVESPFLYKTDAKTIAPLDQFQEYQIDDQRLDSGLMSPSYRSEFYNPIAYESEGVTELNTNLDPAARTKAASRLNRMNNMFRLSLYTDSAPKKYMVGKCINLDLPINAPGVANGDMKDELFSGKYLITRLRHYIKGEEYTMSIEVIRDGISIPKNKTDVGEPGP